jgi:hypothetical protein
LRWYKHLLLSYGGTYKPLALFYDGTLSIWQNLMLEHGSGIIFCWYKDLALSSAGTSL